VERAFESGEIESNRILRKETEDLRFGGAMDPPDTAKVLYFFIQLPYLAPLITLYT
jgi:hypothetical protein